MSAYVDLSTVELRTNSSWWKVSDSADEVILQVVGNTDQDAIGGKVALFEVVTRNYQMVAEMRFLGHHLTAGTGGWFGFAMRAQDLSNYELVWFMPNAEGPKTVAYVPVAHGVVPWWTEAYATQDKGGARIPVDAWFQAGVTVIGDEFTAYVDEEEIFTKKLTYYLREGRPGFYVGTATDAAFRRISIESLD